MNPLAETLVEALLEIELTPEQIAVRDEAFEETASAQRHGDPEYLGARAGLHEPAVLGLLGDSMEHIGDLTHRLGEKFSFFGGSYAKPKIRSQFRRLTNRYGFQREVEEQIARNAQFYAAEYPGQAKYQYRDAHDALERAKAFGRRYAEAHAQIPVWNRVQWHARQAAIDLGNWDFSSVVNHLLWLNDRIEDGTFDARAGEFTGQPYTH